MLLNWGVGEDSWESLGLQGDPTSPSWRKSVLNIHWKDWCWNSNTLITWCKELTHLRRPWCWERLRAGGEGDDRGWDCWIASLTQWTWVWINSGSWWWTGRPGVLRHGVAKNQTRLSDWTELSGCNIRMTDSTVLLLKLISVGESRDRWERWDLRSGIWMDIDEPLGLELPSTPVQTSKWR